MEHEYIKEMFTRMNLQQIREFIVSGMELDKLDKRTYSERLENGSKHIIKRIKGNARDESELDELYTEFSDATEAYTEVFLEIGMKLGAKLLFQLLYQDE
ncbi:MAG: hypothetical protein FWD71_20555 [Oscillospiraceae bacterium]|nr:hypothetical protein [Oscillospiraceae bacterium]